MFKEVILKGRVKTYLGNKGYGFIKGDDGKDYFFHVDEFVNSKDIKNVCEDAYVEFDQVATPKGYKAVQCKLLNGDDVKTYVTPANFLTSKFETIKGWELIEHGSWFVYGSSKDSPDHAKKEAIAYANSVGANALIQLEYFKTTGEENKRSIFDSPNYKGGIYRYTIHNFRGRIAVAAKKNALGNHLIKDLVGTNKKAEELKAEMDSLNNKNRTKRLIGGLVFGVGLIIAFGSGNMLWVVVGALGLVTSGLPVNRGHWLKNIAEK